MTPTHDPTHVRPKAVLVNPARYRTNMEALYPREGFLITEDGIKPIYLGHPNATCLDCERPMRKHPASDQFKGLVVICGDKLMRLTEQKA